MRKISSFIMACAMCLSMTVVGTVAPQVAVQAEETAAVELKEAHQRKLQHFRKILVMNGILFNILNILQIQKIQKVGWKRLHLLK